MGNNPNDFLSLYRIPWERRTGASAAAGSAMQNDPLHIYWIRDGEKRSRVLPGLYRTVCGYGIGKAHFYAASAELEGIALWLFPGDRDFTSLTAIRYGAFRLFVTAGPDTIYRMMSWEETAARVRKEHAPAKGYYLFLLAVKPEYQGQGYAGNLLRPVLQKADADGLPVYLETQNPANLPLYEHFGFRVTCHVKSNRDIPDHFFMVRGK
jgi:GNAT superfamily N-acetyltransferase